MIDAKSAGRLLVKHWNDTTELARTLYEMATSRQESVIESPVVMRVPDGIQALRIESPPLATFIAEEPPSGPPAPEPARFVVPEPPAPSYLPEPDRSPLVRAPEPSRPGSAPSTPTDASPFRYLAPDASPSPPAPRTGVAIPQRGQNVPSPAAPLPRPTVPPAVSRAQVARTAREGLNARFGVVSTPTFADVNAPEPNVNLGVYTPPTPISTSRPSKTNPHSVRQVPAMEVVGSFAASPNQAVTFALPPMILNPRTRQYEPLKEWAIEGLTHIKRGMLNFDSQIGVVVGTTTSNGYWRVRIFPAGYANPSGYDDGSKQSFLADVLVIGAANGSPAPTGKTIGPIMQWPSQVGADDNEYVYVKPSGGTVIAKVTTEIAKATSSTRPGKGKIQVYTAIDMTTTPATLSGLTGIDEDCININQEKKIAVNTTVVASMTDLGVYEAIKPESCTALIP